MERSAKPGERGKHGRCVFRVGFDQQIYIFGRARLCMQRDSIRSNDQILTSWAWKMDKSSFKSGNIRTVFPQAVSREREFFDRVHALVRRPAAPSPVLCGFHLVKAHKDSNGLVHAPPLSRLYPEAATAQQRATKRDWQLSTSRKQGVLRLAWSLHFLKTRKTPLPNSC